MYPPIFSPKVGSSNYLPGMVDTLSVQHNPFDTSILSKAGSQFYDRATIKASIRDDWY